MSIFHWLRGSTDEPRLSPELKARLDALDEANRLQAKGLKALELDWQEWYDKFRLLFMRLSKRIKDAGAAAEADGDGSQSSQDAPQSTNPRAVGYDRPYNGQRTVRRNYGER